MLFDLHLAYCETSENTEKEKFALRLTSAKTRRSILVPRVSHLTAPSLQGAVVMGSKMRDPGNEVVGGVGLKT